LTILVIRRLTGRVMPATALGARPARRPTALQLVVVEPLRRLVAPPRAVQLPDHRAGRTPRAVQLPGLGSWTSPDKGAVKRPHYSGPSTGCLLHAAVHRRIRSDAQASSPSRCRQEEEFQQRLLGVQSRFSASSQTTERGPSITEAATSSPRCAGRQCMKSGVGRVRAITASLTWKGCEHGLASLAPLLDPCWPRRR
jgi:hypothetical protein